MITYCKGSKCDDFKILEQENTELKEKIKEYAAINEQETKDYAALKAENEQLKKDTGDKELIQLISDYAFLKRRFERISSKLEAKLEERENDANRQIHTEIKTGHDITG